MDSLDEIVDLFELILSNANLDSDHGVDMQFSGLGIDCKGLREI